jgi:hypothetical protein
MIDSEIKLGLLNLHDAFLNADLSLRQKWAAPIDPDPEKFPISDHGRFERIWVMFLYVLFESWESRQMRIVRDYVGSVASLAELTGLIRSGKQKCSFKKMKATRDYMCHRDQRKYWDDGRLAVCGQLEYHMQLHQAFSEVLLQAFRKLNQ